MLKKEEEKRVEDHARSVIFTRIVRKKKREVVKHAQMDGNQSGAEKDNRLLFREQ